MSPEQIAANRRSSRSDIFSLGVVLYEILSDERPFPGDSSPALMSSILRDSPRAAGGSFALTSRRESRRLVARCLQKIRPQSHPEGRPRKSCRNSRRCARRSNPARGGRRRGRGAAAGGRLASIAVLPFTDMSAAKDQDWFCDGIAEEILNALAPLKGLKVAARASAFSFRGKNEDLRGDRREAERDDGARRQRASRRRSGSASPCS